MPSARSGLKFGGAFFEFGAGVCDLELPVDAALFGVRFLRPGGDFGLEELAAAGEALAGQTTEFALGESEPASMSGGVNEVQAFHVSAGLFGRECFLEGSPRVRVEVVADERDRRTLRVARVPQRSHFQRPVGLRSRRPRGRLTERRQRFGKPQKAGGLQAFVVVVDSFRVRLRGGKATRVSPINGTGRSSRQTTGQRES